MKSEDKKRYFQIILLMVAAGSIYTLPYIRTNFQQAFIDAFGLDMTAFSNLYAMLGLMFIIGYVPSGWIADKFSSRSLVVVSLFVTGLVGLYVGTIPPSSHLTFVFLIWGISTVFTFWSSLIKGVNLLSKPEEQAKVFGFLDGGRGVVEALLATISISIFAAVVGGSSAVEDTIKGLQVVIYFYSAVILVVGVLIVIFMREPKSEVKTEEKPKITMDDFMTVVKSPAVWVMSGVIFTGYTLFWTTYYMGGYLVANFGLSLTVAGTITTAMMWMRPIGGIGGGILADKFGKERVLAVSMLLASIALGGFAIYGGSMIYLIAGFVLFIGLMSYAIRGLYWSILDDCKLDSKVLGIAIGFISFMGYLPDIFIPMLTNPIFENYPEADAYSIYFIASVVVGLIGVVITFVFKKIASQK